MIDCTHASGPSNVRKDVYPAVILTPSLCTHSAISIMQYRPILKLSFFPFSVRFVGRIHAGLTHTKDSMVIMASSFTFICLYLRYKASILGSMVVLLCFSVGFMILDFITRDWLPYFYSTNIITSLLTSEDQRSSLKMFRNSIFKKQLNKTIDSRQNVLTKVLPIIKGF